MPNLRLGPFHLLHRIGRGGMSDVWLAHHTRDDVRVAVKVLTAERARKPHNLRMFRTEIRAVARLDHPHVVGVHDAGIVPADVAALSEGLLQPGMPYLVMDLLAGGTLWEYRGRLPWSDLRGLLLRLLDALAHAHARGVVHRDLKLTNILLTHPERRAVITDFGLAQLRRDDTAVHLPAGTPAYMAPEQFVDAWRDFGPWTDLYGFGCFAWALATGSAPFTDDDWATVRDAHLHGALPPFEPVMPVPPGFQAWLEALLTKDLTRRTQRAADAAWALERLDATVPDGPTLDAPLDVRPSEASTLTFGPTAALLTGRSVGRHDTPPPPPQHWAGLPPRARLQLRGAGLGLYTSRPIPTIGRTTEHDLLWEPVVALHSGAASASCVLLEGPAGTGKTHLARWLTERAHELGAAHVWWCDHHVRSGPNYGLADMLRAHLHAQGLEDHNLDRHVAHASRSWGTTAPADQQVLAQLLHGDEPTSPHAPTPASRQECLSALVRHAHHVAARRPLIVVLDDAQQDVDALLFALALLQATPARILVVLGLRDRAHVGATSSLVDKLKGKALRLRVAPLPASDHLDMVRKLLGLEGELALRVAERTEGNPGFAASLVADWVARDQLIRGPGGFRLRPGVDDALPDDLFAFWRDDLNRALGSPSRRVRAALELAAVLGMHVDTLRWRRIAARAGLEANLDVVDVLIAHRLVEGTRPSHTWRFAHAMIREALLRGADEAGRRLDLHRWVLEDLERQPSVDVEEHAAHLLGAGRTSEAVGRLVLAARRQGERGHPHGVLDLLDRAERAIVGEAHLESRWRRELDVGRVRALVLLGRLDEGLAAADRVLPSFTDAPDHPDRAAVQTLQARVALFRGDGATAEQLLSVVIARLQPEVELPPTHPERLADAMRVLGLVVMATEPERSEQLLRQALDWASVAQAGAMWAETAGFLATVLSLQGQHEEASAVLQEALVKPEAQARALRASLLNIQAELLRVCGRTHDAVPYYEEAVALLEQVGSLEAAVPRLNLAMIAAIEERFDEAWALGERSGHEGTVQGRPPLQLAVRAVLLVAALGLQYPEAAIEQAEQFLALDAAGATSEPEVYDLAGKGVAMLQRAGLGDLAASMRTAVDRRR